MRVLDDFLDRLAMREQRNLTLAHMRVIADGAARRTQRARNGERRGAHGMRVDAQLRGDGICAAPENRQRLRPSYGTIFSCVGSTSCRQRTLIAAISLPFRSEPRPNGATPQTGQNECLMLCLLNVYVEISDGSVDTCRLERGTNQSRYPRLVQIEQLHWMT